MNRRRSVAIFVVAVLSFMLAACSGISSGKIIDKHYEESYYYTTTVCSGYSTKGYCIVWVPITHHVDEKWVFTLENEEGKTGDLAVSKQDYDNVPLGTIYTKPE